MLQSINSGEKNISKVPMHVFLLISGIPYNGNLPTVCYVTLPVKLWLVQ